MSQDLLEPEDALQFIKLHQALTLFANRELKIVKPPPKSRGIVSLPQEDRLKVWQALVKKLSLIDAFVKENPYKLEPDELEIVSGWKELVSGEFYVLRFLKKYTIFLAAKEPAVAYGVVALTEPLEVVIEQPLPFYTKAILMPFKGRIVYDGLLAGYNVIIGGNMTRELNEIYQKTKKRDGVVTSLPWNPEKTKAAANKPAGRKKRARKKSGLVGHWRIVWMEGWDQDYVDEEVEGYIEIKQRQSGDFQFGYVQGAIDYREVERDGKPAVEFTWEGNSEMDPASGRGWAALNEEELEGEIFIHDGDDSAFRAIRKQADGDGKGPRG